VTFSETNPPRRGGPLCPPARFDSDWPIIDVDAALASVDASRACRGRRVLCEISMTVWFGLAWRFRLLARWVDHPRWWPQWIWFAALYVSIVDGARPGSRRM
jgi:hypothetical protein